MTKLAPEWVRTSDPVIRSPARYRWTTAPAIGPVMRNMTIMRGMLVGPDPMSRSTVLFVLPGWMNRSTVTHPAGPVMGNITIMMGMLSYPKPGSDEPVNSVTPSWTSVEECVVYAGEQRCPIRSTVTPSWTSVEECVVYAGEQSCPIRSTVLLVHLGWMIRMASVSRMVKIMKVLLPYTGPVQIRHSKRLLVSSAREDPAMRPGR